MTAIVREEIASFGSPDARDFRIKELEFEAGFLRDMVKNCLSDARAMADKTGEAYAQLFFLGC